jgi:3-methyladenine DNA glycosylase AlkD
LIKERLFLHRDEKYRKFMSALLPTVENERIIGVRMPELRGIAKELIRSGKSEEFLSELPHTYYEENNLHAFIINELDYAHCISALDAFLPTVDNWGTCDSLRPKCFKKHRARLILKINEWLLSEHTYTVRFAIEMLMIHFLGDDFKPEFLDTVAAVRSDDYYLCMMVAWYFATALFERYEDAVPYITQKRLSPFVHNKTISKALDSLRIDGERKAFLKKQRIK